MFNLFNGQVSLYRKIWLQQGPQGEGPAGTHTPLYTTCVRVTHDVTEYKSWVLELRVTTPGEHLLRMHISKTGFYVTASGGDVGEIAWQVRFTRNAPAPTTGEARL